MNILIELKLFDVLSVSARWRNAWRHCTSCPNRLRKWPYSEYPSRTQRWEQLPSDCCWLWHLASSSNNWAPQMSDAAATFRVATLRILFNYYVCIFSKNISIIHDALRFHRHTTSRVICFIAAARWTINWLFYTDSIALETNGLVRETLKDEIKQSVGGTKSETFDLTGS